jgi:signal transduction histidine kinase
VGLQSRLTNLAFRPHLPRRTVRLSLTLLYGCLFLISGAGLLGITYVLVDNRLSGPLRSTGGSLPHNASAGIVTAPSSARTSFQAQQAADLHQLLIQSSIALAIMAVVSVGLGWLMAGRTLRPLRTMTATTRRISEHNLHERLALGGPDDELTDLGHTIDGLLARLETAFDSQRRFVANASHELRTPLMLTQTLLQVALADPAITFESLRAACEEVIDVGKEQAQLIEALLTLARSQRGLDHRETFDLADITDLVLRAHQSEITTRRLRIDSSLTHTPISGDRRLVEILVSNLLENAIRHNVPDGHIHVAVGSDRTKAALTVSNTGAPVRADQIERLLQPFQHLDGQRSSDREGLGLGLSIVDAIASAHDATLSVNVQPSGGLSIGVAFPQPASPESNAGEAPPAHGPPTEPPGSCPAKFRQRM